MSPFIRGFLNGWNTIYGGADAHFGSAIGFVTALMVGMFGILITIVLIAEIFDRRKKIVAPIKEWWKDR